MAQLPEMTSEKRNLWRYGQRSPPPGRRRTQLPNTSRARRTRTRRRRPNKLLAHAPRPAPGPTPRDRLVCMEDNPCNTRARDHGTPSTRRPACLTSNTGASRRTHSMIPSPGGWAGHDSPPFSRPEPAAPVPPPPGLPEKEVGGNECATGDGRGRDASLPIAMVSV